MFKIFRLQLDVICPWCGTNIGKTLFSNIKHWWIWHRQEDIGQLADVRSQMRYNQVFNPEDENQDL